MCEGCFHYIHINNTVNIWTVVRRLSLCFTTRPKPLTMPVLQTCDLVLTLPIYGSCLHILRSLSYTALLPSIFLSTACFIWRFLRKVWPVLLIFLHFISCRIFTSSLTLCNISFLTRSFQLVLSILSRNHITELSQWFWYNSRSCQVSAPHKFKLHK